MRNCFGTVYGTCLKLFRNVVFRTVSNLVWWWFETCSEVVIQNCVDTVLGTCLKLLRNLLFQTVSDLFGNLFEKVSQLVPRNCSRIAFVTGLKLVRNCLLRIYIGLDFGFQTFGGGSRKEISRGIRI